MPIRWPRRCGRCCSSTSSRPSSAALEDAAAALAEAFPHVTGALGPHGQRDKGRNPAAATAQQQYAENFADEVKESIFDSLRRGGMKPAQAEAEASRQTDDLMKKLAALHEPDMVAGGWADPQPKTMGRTDVNSSIGASWNQNGRLSSMDADADDAIANGRGGERMNVKLEVCRGNGLR